MEETKIIDLSNRFYKLIALLVGAFVVLSFGKLFYEFGALPQNYPKEINVNGEGKTFAKPDIATVSLGMNTQGLKSQEVVDRNNEVMQKVIDAVKGLGVDEKDIQTTAYNLMPLYDYTERGRVFKGYSLDQQVRVKIRNFDIISDVLDKATSLEANTVGDLQFTVDDMEQFRAEARAKAIAQAREKATTLANQAGLSLGRLVNISEGYNSFPPVPYGVGFGGADLKETVAPSIETGQLEITSTVTLTYRVR